MTEHEWLVGTDTQKMLALIEETASDRKMRLFLVGCARSIWKVVSRDDVRVAVEVAERFAESAATKDDLFEQNQAMWDFFGRDCTADQREFAWGKDEGSRSAFGVALKTTCPRHAMKSLPRSYLWNSRRLLTERHQAPLLRDIFGNPFRSAALEPSWLTSTVTTLAEAIYLDRQSQSGSFDKHLMGMLGDALEDAGCDNRAILDHCRCGGEHVKGCHVVDLVLAKE